MLSRTFKKSPNLVTLIVTKYFLKFDSNSVEYFFYFSSLDKINRITIHSFLSSIKASATSKYLQDSFIHVKNKTWKTKCHGWRRRAASVTRLGYILKVSSTNILTNVAKMFWNYSPNVLKLWPKYFETVAQIFWNCLCCNDKMSLCNQNCFCYLARVKQSIFGRKLRLFKYEPKPASFCLSEQNGVSKQSKLTKSVKRWKNRV